MKKILSIGLILLLVLSMFVLAACGGKDMQQDMTSMSEELSSDMSSIGDELTENGNITGESTTEDTLTTKGDIVDDVTGALTTENGSTTNTTAAAE